MYTPKTVDQQYTQQYQQQIGTILHIIHSAITRIQYRKYT